MVFSLQRYSRQRPACVLSRQHLSALFHDINNRWQPMKSSDWNRKTERRGNMRNNFDVFNGTHIYRPIGRGAKISGKSLIKSTESSTNDWLARWSDSFRQLTLRMNIEQVNNRCTTITAVSLGNLAHPLWTWLWAISSQIAGQSWCNLHRKEKKKHKKAAFVQQGFRKHGLLWFFDICLEEDLYFFSMRIKLLWLSSHIDKS